MAAASTRLSVCLNCGADPWSARVPPDPLFANRISRIQPGQADEGVGRGPGGPPHNYCGCSGLGKPLHYAVFAIRIAALR
jgi:hypothetical protein